MRKVLYVFIAILAAIPLRALEPTWSIEFGSVFDNREGDGKICDDKTFFFTTLAPEAGLKFTATDRIAGGVVWNQPLENGVRDGKVYPTLYYRHDGQAWKFSMGMFPRTQLREPLPGFMWCDSLAYFQRNIRGALVQYAHTKGFFDAYIDWRQMQSETRREAFNIVFHGQWYPTAQRGFAGAHLLMNHFAKTRHPAPDERIVDNFMVNPYVGADLGRLTPVDSLVVRAGAVATIERNRASGKWAVPAGAWVDLTAEWRFLGLRNSFYAGGRLMPLWGEFADQLYQGEPYYSSSFYDRADLYAKVYSNRFMSLQAELNFNFARSTFMFYQRLILIIHLGR